MTEKERRLTIERIDKYKKEAKRKDNDILIQGIYLLFAWATVLFSSYYVGSIEGNDSFKEIFQNVGFLVSIPGLKDLLIAISRKTGIEIKIEDLEAQLKLDEFEQEEKGKNR